MAKSKKPRKPYRRPDYSGEAASLNPEKYGEAARAEQSGVSESVEQAHPEPVHIDKEPVAPAHPHVTHRAPRGRSRYLVPVAAGAGVIGGGAFLANRARRRKATMAKALVNPLTGEGVTFEKRYIEDDIDVAPRGALVAKARGKHAADTLLRRGGRRVVQAAGAPKRFGGGFLDTVAEGQIARGEHATQRGKMGASRRAGALTSALGGGSLAMYGLGHSQGKYGEQERNREKQRAAAARRRKANTSKRHDETALEHTGSRRVGGRLPVSSTRVPGLPVQSATFSRGNPEARPGTRSHANKLTHVHTNVKASRTGKLLLVKHGSRSRSGTSIGKSAGYAQSGGHGRRLVNV